MVDRIRTKRAPAKLRAIRLSELSLVDRPANPHARVTLFKREEDDEDFGKAGGGNPNHSPEDGKFTTGGGSAISALSNDSSSASDKGKTVYPFVQNFFNDHKDTADQKRTLRGLSDDKLRSVADLLSRDHPKYSTSDSHSNKLFSLVEVEAKRRSLDLTKNLEKKYKTTSELPDSVRGALPAAAQRQFLAVVNSALDGGASDTSAFSQAWGALKNSGWHKDKGGTWVKKDYGDAEYSATLVAPADISREVQALDFDTILAEQEARDAAEEVGRDLREKWCALQRAFSTIAADESVSAADKITAMQASLQQYVDSLAEQSTEIADTMTKSLLAAAPALTALLEKEEGDEPMTAAEKQQLTELQKTVEALTKKLEAATATDPTKKAAEIAGELEKAKAQVAELTAKLETTEAEGAEAIAKAAMSDAEKTHMAGLSGQAKIDFMRASSEDRKKTMAKAASADAVVYKSESTGEEFRKSDDPRLVTMAKAADEDRKIAKEERAKRETAELSKRADDELKNFSEDVAKRDDKIEVLRAVEKMDAGPRAALLKMLEVGGKAIAAAFQTIGHRGEGLAKTAQAFEKHVSDIMVRDKVSKTAAMSKARAEFPDAFSAYQSAGGVN